MTNRICIVEDDEGIQDVLKIILQNAGYETIIFTDGEPILQNDYPLPDLYLLDKQLQGFDGLNLCEFLKLSPRTKGIPVVLMSAYPGIRELALGAGANDFIEKPFTISTLLQAIQSLIGKQIGASAVR